MRGCFLLPTLVVLVALLGSGCKEREQTEAKGSELARQGGIEIVVETDAEQRDKLYAALLKRVEGSASPKATLHKEGSSRVVIRIPGATDIKRYKRLMTERAFIAWMLVAEDYLLLDESNTWNPRRLLEVYDRAVMQLPDSGPDPSRPDDPEAIVPYKDDEGDLVNFEAFDKKLKDEALIPVETILRVYEDVDRLGNTVRTPLLLRSSEDEPCVLSGDDLNPESFTVVRGSYGEPQVRFEIKTDEAKKRFEDVTGRYSSDSENRIAVERGYRGWRLAILFDDTVLSAPTIRTKLSDGGGVITFGSADTFGEADLLVAQLRTGSLPRTVRVVTVRVVPPGGEAE